MSLLGKANWWLPRWLDRILPHMDLEGTAVHPDRQPTGPELEPVAA
jgi:RND superfamily putative drug exporter